MDTEKRVFEVEVAGLPLKLRSSYDPETVQNIVRLVDEKVNQAMSGNSKPSFQNALLLASLHLAEEMLVLKQTAKEELSRLEEKTLEIMSEIKPSRNTQKPLDV